MKRVAVHVPYDGAHPTHWSMLWLGLNDPRFEFEAVNLLDCDVQSVAQNFDCVLWCVDHYRHEETAVASILIDYFENSGLTTFPSSKDIKFFDDKVHQSLLMASNSIRAPKFHLFFSKTSALSFVDKADFPIVFKLKRGSGSHNVKLITDGDVYRKYVDVMFGNGMISTPKIGFKISSNIRSVASLTDVWQRTKKIPGFIKNIKSSQSLPREQGYIYSQELIENDGFDIKIAIVNDKLSYACRNVRKKDFRASGSGFIFYDRALISDSLLEAAKHAYRALELTCAGFDFVIESGTGQPFLIEMCFGFSNVAQYDCGEYYDLLENEWIEKPLNPAEEVLSIL